MLVDVDPSLWKHAYPYSNEHNKIKAFSPAENTRRFTNVDLMLVLLRKR